MFFVALWSALLQCTDGLGGDERHNENLGNVTVDLHATRHHGELSDARRRTHAPPTTRLSRLDITVSLRYDPPELLG